MVRGWSKGLHYVVCKRPEFKDSIVGLKEKEHGYAKRFMLTNPELKSHRNLDEISEELKVLRSDL